MKNKKAVLAVGIFLIALITGILLCYRMFSRAYFKISNSFDLVSTSVGTFQEPVSLYSITTLTGVNYSGHRGVYITGGSANWGWSGDKWSIWACWETNIEGDYCYGGGCAYAIASFTIDLTGRGFNYVMQESGGGTFGGRSLPNGQDVYIGDLSGTQEFSASISNPIYSCSSAAGGGFWFKK